MTTIKTDTEKISATRVDNILYLKTHKNKNEHLLEHNEQKQTTIKIIKTVKQVYISHYNSKVRNNGM